MPGRRPGSRPPALLSNKHLVMGSSGHRVKRPSPSGHQVIGSSDPVHRVIGSSGHRVIGSSDPVHRVIGSSGHRVNDPTQSTQFKKKTSSSDPLGGPSWARFWEDFRCRHWASRSKCGPNSVPSLPQSSIDELVESHGPGSPGALGNDRGVHDSLGRSGRSWRPDSVRRLSKFCPKFDQWVALLLRPRPIRPAHQLKGRRSRGAF